MIKKVVFLFFAGLLSDSAKAAYVQYLDIQSCCRGNLSGSVWCGNETVIYGVCFCLNECASFYANAPSYAASLANNGCVLNGATLVSHNLISARCVGTDEVFCSGFNKEAIIGGSSDSGKTVNSVDSLESYQYGKGEPFFSIHYSDNFRQLSSEMDIRGLENSKPVKTFNEEKVGSLINQIYKKVVKSKKNENRMYIYGGLISGNETKDIEYQTDYYKLLETSKNRDGVKEKKETPQERAKAIMDKLNDEEERQIDCSMFTAMIYKELEKSKTEIKDCGAKNREECLLCSPEAYPCLFYSQKQYEYLKKRGKITDNIEELKPGDVLFFKDCDKQENCPIAHTIFMEWKSEDSHNIFPKEKNELKCTQDKCPISIISTSDKKSITEKNLTLKNGCYTYCPTGKEIYNKNGKIVGCAVERKKQCFVGGGRP